MPATGFVIAKTQSNDTLASTAWSNQANVLVDSDTEAIEAITAKNIPASGAASGGWLKLGNFGFDSLIPATAIIDKVELQIRWRMNSTAGVGNRENAWALSGTRGPVQTYGETTTLSTDLVDVTGQRAWTRANLLDAVFAVHVRGRNGNSATDPSYRFAWVKVQVTYTVPAPPEPIQETLYDDFNRADDLVYVGAGASKWMANRLDYEALTKARVIGNQLGVQADGAADYSQAVGLFTLGPEDWDLLMDCAATGAAPNELAVWFNAKDIQGTAPIDGYTFIGSSATDYWQIRKWTNGSWAVLAPAVPAGGPIVVGDTVWIAKRGSTFSVYRRPSGGSFAKCVEGTDASPYLSGWFAIEMSDTSIRWENVRGGPFVAPIVPIDETLIDDFNRANGQIQDGAGATLWEAGNASGSNPTLTPKIFSNQIGVDPNVSTNRVLSKFWLARNFDLLIDCMVKPANTGGVIAISFAIGEGLSSTWDGYRFFLFTATSWQLEKVVDGVSTVLGTVGSASLPVPGDTIWVAKRGTSLTVYRRPSGGNFIPIVSVTDSIYDRPGPIEIHFQDSGARPGRWDNVRGGPLYSPPVPIVSVV